VVLELEDLAEAEPRAVEDAGVVERVEHGRVVPAEQTREHAEIDLEAGREGEGGFAAHERGEALLEAYVDVERAVEQARAGAAGAVLLEGRARGLLDLGMVGEAEVVVRAEHDE